MLQRIDVKLFLFSYILCKYLSLRCAISQIQHLSFLPQPQIHFACSQIQHKSRTSCQSQECCRAGTGSVDLAMKESLAPRFRHTEELIHCHHNQPGSPEQQTGECSRLQSLMGSTRHSFLKSPFHLPLLACPYHRQQQQQCCRSHPIKTGLISPKRKL